MTTNKIGTESTKLPPSPATHDIAAEVGYLSAIFADQSLRHDLDPSALYVPTHRLCLDVLRSLIEDRRAMTTDAVHVGLLKLGVETSVATSLALELGNTLGRDQVALAARLEDLAQIRREEAVARAAGSRLARRDFAGARDEIDALQRHGTRAIRWFSDADSLFQPATPVRLLFTRRDETGESGFAERGVSTVVAGPPGAGKSRFAAALALAVALPGGGSLGDLRAVAPGRVLYVSAEETLDTVGDRLRSARQALGIDAALRTEIEGRIARVGRDGDGSLATVVSGRLVPSKRMTSILREARSLDEWSLVIVDTLSRSAPVEVEESPGMASTFVALLEIFCDELRGRPSVWCLHHFTKDAEKVPDFRAALLSASSVRGSSALVGAARVVINLRAMRDPRFVAVAIAKGNDVRAGQWSALVRDPRFRGALRGPSEDERADAIRLFGKVTRGGGT